MTFANSFALRPCEESTELILGVYGRALAMYPSIRLYAINPISSHDTILLSGSPKEISQFLCFVKTNISKELRRLHALPYSVFAKKRASVLPLSPDEATQVARFRYVLSQGTKEDLVESPRNWPGVTGVHALEKGEPLYGWWFDRTAESKARRRGEEFDKYEYATRYDVPMTPLPCWADLSENKWRARVTETINDIAETAFKRRVRDEKTVLGAKAVQAHLPTDTPEKVEKSPSPLVLAVTENAYKALRRVFDDFCDLFWEQSRRSRQEPEADVEFPPFSFPPGKPMTDGPAPPLELAFALVPG